MIRLSLPGRLGAWLCNRCFPRPLTELERELAKETSISNPCFANCYSREKYGGADDPKRTGDI